MCPYFDVTFNSNTLKTARFSCRVQIVKGFFCIIFSAFFLFNFFPNFSNIATQEKIGEEEVAKRYAAYVMDAVNAGRNAEAKAFLLRAADYASVSSDLSYLLALVESRMGDNQHEVLATIRLAITTDRFNVYSQRDARLLEARTLLTIKNYGEALRSLSLQDDSEPVVELRLLALIGLNDLHGFRRLASDAITRYPRNTVFARLIFRYYSRSVPFFSTGSAVQRSDIRQVFPSDEDRSLVDTVLKRLPSLLLLDPDLAYIAAPFLRDTEMARNILTTWRSTQSDKASIPVDSLPISLDLGVISDETAIYELFKPQTAARDRSIDKKIIEQVFNLLRADASRNAFMNDLLRFSGTITEDENADGINETFTIYDYGMISSWHYDKNQEGEPDMIVRFSGGDPVSCELLNFHFIAEDILQRKAEALAKKNKKQLQTFITWEQYPSVFEAVLKTDYEGDYHFYFKPNDFYYPVLDFIDLCEAQGLLYPKRNITTSDITQKSLLSATYLVEKPSAEFPGAIEKIECKNGIIILSKEYLNGKLISYTDYSNGTPIMQSVDLDLDGRMDTRRYFNKARTFEAQKIFPLDNNFIKSTIDRIERDFDGDGIFETVIFNG
ncbi:MAG: hypothetical protein Ta2B_25590 [Termitinemataceae bacterium]|nr:MAG: hypothetical protein Ta2B_25590 [Termitinemataceae bacterium]